MPSVDDGSVVLIYSFSPLMYDSCNTSIETFPVMAGQGVLAMKGDIKLPYQLSKAIEPLIKESPNYHSLRAKCSGFDISRSVPLASMLVYSIESDSSI